VRSAGGDDPVDRELATSVGLGEEALARLMHEIGFSHSEGVWRWHGRRNYRRGKVRNQSHAFAELEKLRRK
jgi:hypothetical protein